MKVRILSSALFLMMILGGFVQKSHAQVKVSDPYLVLNAHANDALFTTYAASKDRSRFFADKAYFMDYFSPSKPITYSSQFAGDWSVIWKVNNVVISRIRDFAVKPEVVASFPDMAVLKYEPFAGLKVQETFFVYSSGVAMISMHITNNADREYDFNLYPAIHATSDSLKIVSFDSTANGYVFSHYEPMRRPISNLYPGYGYPTHFRDLLASNKKLSSYGGYQGATIQDFYYDIKRMSKVHSYVKRMNEKKQGPVQILALQNDFHLNPGQSADVRFVRGVQDESKNIKSLKIDVNGALNANIQQYVDNDVSLFKSIPRIKFPKRDQKMVYIGALNLVRQCLLPPRAKTKYNYYVFSRNPIWGWANGHQVMHESLSMIPYSYLDPKSAEQSQRIYINQQYPDGLIAYRVGPRGPQVYPHKGKATTSAPFFSWTNWEIYRNSHDKQFLSDAYKAGGKYIDYLEKERDKDHDGMFEWGPYGIIENVRDAWNVVFQLFSEGQDEGRDISNQLEDLDLTCQVANEVFYLQKMANVLGDRKGEQKWSAEHDTLKKLINKFMWDPKTKFYYHISMADNSFTFEGKSLKRKELIGFLPMWAHVATKEHAKDLVEELQNPKSFWRKYGIPSLAANDPNYSPFVDGCCRWNGPVWLLWNYMVFNGLQNYGYHELAHKVAGKMMLAVSTQLKKNHHFWESYSPDYPVQESPPNYIWDSIMAKVLIETYGKQ